MSPARRRGLARLLALAAALALLVVVISHLGGLSGGSSVKPGPAGATSRSSLMPVARQAARQLPAPVSGEAVTTQPGGGLLVVGGLDSGGASTSGVFRLDPRTGKLTPAGSLSQPLHDAAATTVAGRILVLGGGSTTTTDEVESLTPGGTGRVVGHLPTARSDLSALSLGTTAYVLGGYDGQTTVGPVLQTSDGQRFATVGDLPTPVRYAAVAALGKTIYAFGGELAGGGDSDEIQAIDPQTHQASVIGHLPAPMSHASAVALGGRIYVLGGLVHGAATDRILAFDPSGRRARPAGRLPLAVANSAAATAGGTAYLIGGVGAGGNPLASIITVRLHKH